MTLHTMCVIGIALILGFILVCFVLLVIAGGSRSAMPVQKPAPRRLSPDGRVPKPAPWPAAPASAFPEAHPNQPVRDCITAIRREQGLDEPVGMEFHELLAEEMLRVLELVIVHKETPPSLLLPAIAVVKRARGAA